ncbi:hypothetical protein MCEREM21A_00622 [Sphingomonadaceae bacterium]
MFYKVRRNSDAEFVIEDLDGVDYDFDRHTIYLDTYFAKEFLVEKFMGKNDIYIYKFMVAENLNDTNRDDFEDEAEFREDMINQYMYVPENYVECVSETDFRSMASGVRCAVK